MKKVLVVVDMQNDFIDGGAGNEGSAGNHRQGGGKDPELSGGLRLCHKGHS